MRNCPCPARPAPRGASRPLSAAIVIQWSLSHDRHRARIGVSAAHASPLLPQPPQPPRSSSMRRNGLDAVPRPDVVTLPPHEQAVRTRLATRASPLGSEAPFPSPSESAAWLRRLPSLLQLLETPNPRAAPDRQSLAGACFVSRAACLAPAPLSLSCLLSHLAACLIGMHCFAIPTSSSSRLLALRGDANRELSRTGSHWRLQRRPVRHDHFSPALSQLLYTAHIHLQSLLAISASRSLPLALCLSISPSRSLPLPPVPYERKEDHCYHRYTCQLRRLFHQVLYKPVKPPMEPMSPP